MPRLLSWQNALVLLTSALIVGCSTRGSSEDPQIVAQREKLLLTEEPEGAIPVTEAKTALQERDEIVLVGRIGAGSHTPWDDGKAAFFITDAAAMFDGSEHDHGGENHDPENCPFCKKQNSLVDSLAVVRFVDDRGEVLPVDARRLLGVKENQLVVVRGRGEVDGLGNLIVSAQGIYLRQ